MAKVKSKKDNKKNLKSRLTNNISNINYYFLFSLLIVLIIYSFSLFRPWQPFDEKLIYAETLFPIPKSFEEVFEIIKTFVINSHIESMNSTFSNNIALRSAPLPWSIFVFFSYFFKTNPLFYRLLAILIHFLNTILVWLILKKTTEIFLGKSDLGKHMGLPLLVSLFTLLWAVHSANSEAVLLATNWNGLLTFTFCLGFILYEISFIPENNFYSSFPRIIMITVLFFLTLSFAEHGYSFPVVILLIVFGLKYWQSENFKGSILSSIKLSAPYFFGLLLYILPNLLNADSPLVNLFRISPNLRSYSEGSPLYIFIERNLWLTPQIFFHFLKLLVFPKTLSVYQSNNVDLSRTLFEPYSIFCTLFYLFFILTPIIIFLLSKNKNVKLFSILVYSLFFSMFPYLHIITPTYCLSADRYCYFPSFILILLLFIISTLLLKFKTSRILIILLFGLLTLMSFRTLLRMKDWTDAFTLYDSAIKIERNHLYKGKKLTVLADVLGSQGFTEKMEIYLQDALKELNSAIKEYKSLKGKIKNQPITLKLYGLDLNTKITKAAYGIAIIKRDNYQVSPKDILAFFELYINNNLNLLFCNQLIYYGKLLLQDGQLEKAKKVLEFCYKKYPYYMDIMLVLSDYYLENENNTDKAKEILERCYKFFPNKGIVLYKLIVLYEKTNDIENQAKFSYLLGLRDHFAESYQRAAKLYLDLNKPHLAKESLRKLTKLHNDNKLRATDPLTLLLTSRYLDLTGQRNQIPDILNTAYLSSKSLGDKQDIKVTKGILISLVNVNIHLKNIDAARKYLSEFESIEDLTQEDRQHIQILRQKLIQNS